MRCAFSPARETRCRGSLPLSSLAASPTTGNANHEPILPKVPFGNPPCQSLSAGDRQNLGLSTTMLGKADRVPATLPFDNLCYFGGIHFGCLTENDYKFNQEGNRSTSRMAPADLPGAFYDYFWVRDCRCKSRVNIWRNTTLLSVPLSRAYELETHCETMLELNK